MQNRTGAPTEIQKYIFLKTNSVFFSLKNNIRLFILKKKEGEKESD